MRAGQPSGTVTGVGAPAGILLAPVTNRRAAFVVIAVLEMRQSATKTAMATGKSKAAHIGMYQTGTPRTPST